MTRRQSDRAPMRGTREQAISDAAQCLATMRSTVAQMTPREQAEAAWRPGSGMTVDELEHRIRAERGLDPLAGEEVVDD